MLSAAGITSGLDVDSIVSQLMALERRPLNLLQQKKDTIDTRISAYGDLKSSLSTFQDAMQKLSSPEALKIYNATSGNDAVFTASGNKYSRGFHVTVSRWYGWPSDTSLPPRKCLIPTPSAARIMMRWKSRWVSIRRIP